MASNDGALSAEQSIKSWGEAYLIMVQNQSPFPVNLLFPDQSDSLRILPSGTVMGKAPLGGNSVAQSFIPVTTDRNSLRSDNYPTIENTKISRKPRLSGIGSSYLKGFSEDQTMFLTPFFGNGGVWMVENDFEIPSSITFKIYVEDVGAVAVVFGESEKKIELKVIISSEDGHFVSIENNDVVLTKIDIKSLINEKLAAGKFKSFWINFDTNETLLVGVGNILGESGVAAVKIPDLAKITKRIGFQSFKNSVGISQVKIIPPILFSLEKEQKEQIKEKTTALPINNFSYVFPKQQNTKFNFSGDKNNQKIIFEKDQETIKISFFENTSNENPSFFEIINIPEGDKDGFVIFSVKGKSLYFCCCDKNFEKLNVIKVFGKFIFSDINQLEMDKLPQEKNVFWCPPLKAQPNFLSGIGSKGKKISFSGNLSVLKPFEYEFDQKGPSIICYDKINNDSLILGEAPQQGALYSFNAIIKPSGNLDLNWFLEPINPRKIALKFAVGSLRYIEGTLNTQADQAADETTAEVKMQLAKTAQNLGLALAGAGFRIGAGLAEAELDTFRDNKNFLKLDKMDANDDLKGSIPDNVLVNKKKVDQKIAIISQIKIKSREAFDNLLGELNQIVGFINHPYVVTEVVKQAILINLKKIFSFIDRFQNETESTNKITGQKERVNVSEIFMSALNLLLKICNNSILTDKSTFENQVICNQYYSFLTESSKNFFASIKFNEEFSVPNTNGILLPIGKKLSDSFSLFLSLRGSGKFSVVFFDEKNFSGEMLKKTSVLQLEFGATDNGDILLKTMFDDVVTNTIKNKPEGEFSALEFKGYWINFANNVLSLGFGSFSENELFNKKINFSSKNISFGISSFAENEVKNLITGPAKKDQPEALLAFIKSLNTKTPIFQNKIDETLIIKNASGTFVSSIKKSKNSRLTFFLENSAARINYKIEIEFLMDNVNIKIFNLFSDTPTTPYKKITTTISEENIPFWFEIDKRIFTIGFSNFWESKSDLACMLPGVYQVNLTVKMDPNNSNIEIQQPFILPTKKEIDYQFLSLLSNQKIVIPKNQSEIDKEKNKIMDQEIQATLDDFSQKDLFVTDLSDEDKKVFSDFIKTAIEKDDFDDYMANSLEYEAWDMNKGNDFISSDVLLHDDLQVDPLSSTGKQTDKKDATDGNGQHLERGAIKKLASQGMAGSVAQLKGETMDIKSLKKQAAFSLKNKDGMTDQEIAEEQAKIKGFGVSRDVNTLKREFKQLTAKNNVYAEEVFSEQSMAPKKEFDSSGNATGNILHQYTIDSDGNTRKIYANVFKETSTQINDYLRRKKNKAAEEKSKKNAQKIEQEKEKLSKKQEDSNPAMQPAVVQDFLGKIVRYFKDNRVNEKEPKKSKKETAKKDLKTQKKQENISKTDSTNKSQHQKTKIKIPDLKTFKEGSKSMAKNVAAVSGFGALNVLTQDQNNDKAPVEDEFLETGQPPESYPENDSDRLSIASQNAGLQ